MSTVTSKDGTSIAYERTGSGPALILVGGGLDDGSENAPLAPELAESFTVINYARRGRGESGDTPPYAVERDIEDLDALIAEAGGTAHVFGASSGGALCLEAAAAESAIDRIAVWEVPYGMTEDWRQQWTAYLVEVGTAIDEGRRGDAAEAFLRLTGASEEDIAGIRSSEWWPGMEALAHTLVYDGACLGDGVVPTARLATIARPTLALTGTAMDPHLQAMPIDFHEAADAIVAAMPNAERGILDTTSHMVDAKVIAPALDRFLSV